MYALRTTNLLPVPQTVQDMIATMQLAPVAQFFAKKQTFKKHSAPTAATNSWRTAVVHSSSKKNEWKHDDPDFEEVVAITNKVAQGTLSPSVQKIKDVIKKREDDQVFRMRIVTLLFERGVAMPFFSKLMANMFELLYKDVPILKEDLQFSCSIDCFNKMFDQSETILFPDSSEPDYDSKLCAWNKKKEIRRGFGMFVTELWIRGLVEEDVLTTAIHTTLDELKDMIVKPANSAIGENVDQLVTFLFESTKVISARFGKTNAIVKIVSGKCAELYAIPKTETPCMGMRSRFKLDDISKF
jgi:hypothetical protein